MCLALLYDAFSKTRMHALNILPRAVGSVLNPRAQAHEALLLATIAIRLLAPGGVLVVTRYGNSDSLQFAMESMTASHEEMVRRCVCVF